MGKSTTKKKATTTTGHPRQVTGSDKEFGARIRQRRVEMGISQEELGNKLGVSFQQIQKYEKGINRVALTRAIEIADALDTSVSYLAALSDKNKHTEVDTKVWNIALEMKDLDDLDTAIVLALVRGLVEASAKRGRYKRRHDA